ncbi:MAG: hypothetical protein J6T12_01675 [Salinivirgaceae bacterium]|nr:hypothetical protein [Salinivirgaceae bacterium]
MDETNNNAQAIIEDFNKMNGILSEPRKRALSVEDFHFMVLFREKYEQFDFSQLFENEFNNRELAKLKIILNNIRFVSADTITNRLKDLKLTLDNYEEIKHNEYIEATNEVVITDKNINPYSKEPTQTDIEAFLKSKEEWRKIRDEYMAIMDDVYQCEKFIKDNTSIFNRIITEIKPYNIFLNKEITDKIFGLVCNGNREHKALLNCPNKDEFFKMLNLFEEGYKVIKNKAVLHKLCTLIHFLENKVEIELREVWINWICEAMDIPFEKYREVVRESHEDSKYLDSLIECFQK